MLQSSAVCTVKIHSRHVAGSLNEFEWSSITPVGAMATVGAFARLPAAGQSCVLSVERVSSKTSSGKGNDADLHMPAEHFHFETEGRMTPAGCTRWCARWPTTSTGLGLRTSTTCTSCRSRPHGLQRVRVQTKNHLRPLHARSEPSLPFRKFSTCPVATLRCARSHVSMIWHETASHTVVSTQACNLAIEALQGPQIIST